MKKPLISQRLVTWCELVIVYTNLSFFFMLNRFLELRKKLYVYAEWKLEISFKEQKINIY